MSTFIQAVLKDPGEYAPFLLLLTVVLLLWGALSMSGWFSLRAATPRRRFWLALFALLLGVPCLLGNSPVSIEAGNFHLNFDLRWLFLVPVALGLAGLGLWWRRRRPIPG